MTEPDPLSHHLDLSRKMGRFLAIMLGIVVVVYLAAVVLSDWNLGVVIAGGIVVLIGIVLAWRTRRADYLETDRLMNEGLNEMRGNE